MQIRIVSTGQEGSHTELFPHIGFASGDVDITPEWLAANGCEAVVIPPPVLTDEQIKTQTIEALKAALEAHYDSVAKIKDYDSRLTCVMRAGYSGPYQAEAIVFAAWMDSCVVYGYQVLDACVAGSRAIPTAAELISELPPAPW